MKAFWFHSHINTRASTAAAAHELISNLAAACVAADVAFAVYRLHQRGKELPVQSSFQREKTVKEYGDIKAAPAPHARRANRTFKTVVLWRRGRESKVDLWVVWMTNCKQRRETCVVFIFVNSPRPAIGLREGWGTWTRVYMSHESNESLSQSHRMFRYPQTPIKSPRIHITKVADLKQTTLIHAWWLEPWFC